MVTSLICPRSSVALQIWHVQCKEIKAVLSYLLPVLQSPSSRVYVHFGVTQATVKIFSASIPFIGIQLQDRVCFQNVKNSSISKSPSAIHSSGLTTFTSIKRPQSPSKACTPDQTTFHEHSVESGTSLHPRSHLRTTGNSSSISVISSMLTCRVHTWLPYIP